MLTASSEAFQVLADEVQDLKPVSDARLPRSSWESLWGHLSG
jgi:hypothetical protein